MFYHNIKKWQHQEVKTTDPFEVMQVWFKLPLSANQKHAVLFVSNHFSKKDTQKLSELFRGVDQHENQPSLNFFFSIFFS
jgi:hypothetical protein